MNNRQTHYIYLVSLKTLDDHYLLEYVNNEFINNKKEYKFKKPIRPTQFVYNQLNQNQKVIYNALMKVTDCECPICYDKLNKYNTVRTECKHCFCKDCFSKIIDYSDKCPYCRSEMTKYEELFVTPIVIKICLSFNLYRNDWVLLYYIWVLLGFIKICITAPPYPYSLLYLK